MKKAIALLAMVVGLALPATAYAAPALNLELHHGPTNFAPGADGELWFDIANVGADATTGTTTLQVTLPKDLTAKSLRFFGSSPIAGTIHWSCPTLAGASNFTCSTADPIPRHFTYADMVVVVDVSPGAKSGDRFVLATLSGGGAPGAPPAAGCTAGPAACDFERVRVDPTPAGFAVLPDSFTPDFLEKDGITPVRAAGVRPYTFTVPFDISAVDFDGAPSPHQKKPAGNLRNLRVDTPPGFLGNPTAVGECTAADFAFNHCPLSAMIGRIALRVVPANLTSGNATQNTPTALPVFNLPHPQGSVADLGFSLAGNAIHIVASLDPADGYAITSRVSDINETLPTFTSNLTLWGVPADHAHDAERCLDSLGNAEDTSSECSSDGPLKPFLTTPFQCGTDLSITLRDYDSWQSSGVFGAPIGNDLGDFTECDQSPFDPTVSLAPTTNAADSPSGLDVQIDLPQHENCDPGPPLECDIATSPLRDATVALPEGITVNPASANGLEACTPAQISLGADTAVGCPNGSKIATAKVTTPLLPEPIEGTVYLAAQGDNPFGSLLAGYIVFSDPARGILIKIPGKIDVDPDTGRLTGTFKDNPELPFSQLELQFKGGPHSSLITPKTCGSYTSSAEFSPWSGTAAVQGTDSFTITQSPGGACAGAEADLPNSPAFDAGTESPVSKNYSPFVLHLRREDGTQRFGAFEVTLPPGLTGKLAGTALCSDGDLAAAESKDGREEQATPSCPLDSHVGEVVAATGAGPSPYYAEGDAYLAGPYRGAPVSLAVVTPAVAGPFDLGTIVIRTPLRIDSRTAQITAVSDPIPEMLQGIPTDVRSVDVVMDRPEFTLTGTSCDPMSIDGLLSSTLGQSVPLSVRNQLSDCTRLAFKPQMKLFLKGGTKRGGHPALAVILQPRSGDANIASLSLAMPRSEFLENAHIKTVCTRVQFAADQCPAAAVYGKAEVQTPILDYPLTGNVYLRSSDNLLPDLVPDLRGPSWQPIKVESAGRTDSIRGGIRNTFDFVPDAPFTKLVTKLPGGAKGLLVNSRDICARTYRATVKYTAHNGDSYIDHPKLNVKCKRKRAHKSHGGKYRRAATRHPQAVR